MNKEEYIKREEGAMLHTYNRFPVVLEKGEGVYQMCIRDREKVPNAMYNFRI